MPELRTAVLRKVRFTGKWVEMWFVEPWEEYRGVGDDPYDMSSKGGYLWGAIRQLDDEVYNHVMSHGMAGLQITFEKSEVHSSWEIKCAEGYAHPRKWPERIACAAIHVDDGTNWVHQPVESGLVFGGQRHHNVLQQLAKVKDCFDDDMRRNQIQGFLTTRGRFVDREEGITVAKAAGQVGIPQVPTHKPEELYSEDLY